MPAIKCPRDHLLSCLNTPYLGSLLHIVKPIIQKIHSKRADFQSVAVPSRTTNHGIKTFKSQFNCDTGEKHPYELLTINPLDKSFFTRSLMRL